MALQKISRHEGVFYDDGFRYSPISCGTKFEELILTSTFRVMKRVFAIIIGVVAGFAIIFIGDATTHALSPLPHGLDYTNRAEMREYIASVPLYVLIIMVIFWLASSFLGAMLASRLHRIEWKRTSLITGGILMAAAILNLAMLPHPGWMWISALAGYIPAALLGGWLVRPTTVKLPW